MLTDFDTIVVGSSPLLLVAAVVAAKRGESVAVIEADQSLGGAWRCDDWDGLASVELSAHYLYCSPVAYRFLARLGVVLEPMMPAPFALFGRLRLPLWTLHKIGRLRESIADGNAEASWREMRRLISYGRYYYPVGGAHDLISALATSAVAAGARIIAGECVRRVRIVGDDEYDAVECETASGVLLGGRIITGEGATFSLADRSGAIAVHDRRAFSKTHVLLRFEAADCAQLTYAETARSKQGLIRRVGLAHRGGGDPVWAVDAAPGGRDRCSLIASVLDGLRGYGLIRPHAEPTAARVVMQPSSYWPPDAPSRLSALRNTQISVLNSWLCFGDSLVSFLESATGPEMY